MYLDMDLDIMTAYTCWEKLEMNLVMNSRKTLRHFFECTDDFRSSQRLQIRHVRLPWCTDGLYVVQTTYSSQMRVVAEPQLHFHRC